MAKRASAPPKSVYRLKISLCDAKPAIWRRIEVPDNTRLDHLHLMIQAAMGWSNGHLHMFEIDGQHLGMRLDDFGNDIDDEKKHQLGDLVCREKVRFRYIYDFGDNWEHDVVVEKITPPEPGAKYPRCTAGARACPPEDVGSTWGYAEFLKAIKDPEHDERDSMLEWIGGQFDPEAFDVQDADAAVRDFKSMQFDHM